MRVLEIITNVINLKSNAVYDYKTTRLTFVRALPTNLTESADIVSKLSGTVSQRTLLSQLEFIENVDEEMEQIQKEKDDYNNELNIYSGHNDEDLFYIQQDAEEKNTINEEKTTKKMTSYNRGE